LWRHVEAISRCGLPGVRLLIVSTHNRSARSGALSWIILADDMTFTTILVRSLAIKLNSHSSLSYHTVLIPIPLTIGHINETAIYPTFSPSSDLLAEGTVRYRIFGLAIFNLDGSMPSEGVGRASIALPWQLLKLNRKELCIVE